MPERQVVRELRGLQEEQEHPLLTTRTPTQILTLRILQLTTLTIIITTQPTQTCISTQRGVILTRKSMLTTPMEFTTLQVILVVASSYRLVILLQAITMLGITTLPLTIMLTPILTITILAITIPPTTMDPMVELITGSRTGGMLIINYITVIPFLTITKNPTVMVVILTERPRVTTITLTG